LIGYLTNKAQEKCPNLADGTVLYLRLFCRTTLEQFLPGAPRTPPPEWGHVTTHSQKSDTDSGTYSAEIFASFLKLQKVMHFFIL
jgi:hypothetical protein